MLFFILACISNFVMSGVTKLADKQFKIQFLQESLSITKKLFLLFFIGILSFVIYSDSLKPLLAASYANQILSLPASEFVQETQLLQNALALNTFASPEIAYQVAIDYIDKIAQEPALAQNEEFYTIVSTQLLGTIERSPEQSRNYIALAWLNLYFSGKDRQRINKALDLGDKILTLSPIKKDGYLILAAGYALSNQPAKAREVISQVGKIDVKMGEEIKNYYEKFK